MQQSLARPPTRARLSLDVVRDEVTGIKRFLEG